MLRSLRRLFRASFFSLARRAAKSREARAIAASTLTGLLDLHANLWEGFDRLPEPGYPDLGLAQSQIRTSLRSDIIIITARFRSGSTLLWNLFRHVKGCTAYWEPLNERRNFDPRHRGEWVDPSHLGVKDYFEEYAGLEELGKYFRDSWDDSNLLMGPDFCDPDLERYLEIMVERARGRPVFQFNRIDFRLPWFRRHFPNARYIHLYRHPRDQWCSCLQDHINDSQPGFSLGTEGTFEEFARRDHGLRAWARDLRYYFPFLDEEKLQHPYQLFYLVWKLSYLFGRQYAHYSVRYETLLAEPDGELRRLMSAARVRDYDLGKLKSLIAPLTRGKWKKYAEDEWFRRHEEYCETVLAHFFGTSPAINGYNGEQHELGLEIENAGKQSHETNPTQVGSPPPSKRG